MKIEVLIISFLVFIASFPQTVFSQFSEDFQDALRHSREKNKVNSFVLKAQENIKNGNLNLALTNYSNAIEEYPQADKTYIKRGEVKMRLEKFEEAINDFSLAILIKPYGNYNEDSLIHQFFLRKNAEALFLRGQAKNIIGDHKGALHDYSESLRIHKSSNAYLGKGSIKSKNNMHKEAVEDFTKAIDLDQNNKTAYLLRGSSFIELGKTKKACIDFLKVEDGNLKKKASQLITLFCND